MGLYSPTYQAFRGNMQYLKILCLTFLTLLNTYVYATPQIDEETQGSFLVLSDIHLNYNANHAMQFSPQTATVSNDLDVATYEQLITKIRESIQAGVIDKPQFIVLLGDLVGHVRYSTDDVIENERIAFATLKEAFPDTPILYDFGNNDSLSSDYGVFQTKNPKAKYRSPFDIIKSVWPHGMFLSTGALCKFHKTYPCLLKSETTGGYYSAYLKAHLRLIALNSVMFSHKEQGYSDHARSEQLLWLENQMKEVEAFGDRALLIMHIPPGDNIYKAYFWSDTAFWSYDSARAFHVTIENHHQSIIGVLAAQTHKDEIKIVENAKHVALTGVYLNPALSTSHGNSPAIRSYFLSRQDASSEWSFHDYQTLYFERETNGTISVHSLYRFQDLYCSNGHSPRMSECFGAVNFEKMRRYLSAGNPYFKEKISAPENIHIL